MERGRAKGPADGAGKPSLEVAFPVFCYMDHIGTDRRHGFICRGAVSNGAEHDSPCFRERLDKSKAGSVFWADTAYRSSKNERFKEKRGLESKIRFRRAPGKMLSKLRGKTNADRSKLRSGIEHVFTRQKGSMAHFVRTIAIARAKMKIGKTNPVYNMHRLVWQQGRTAPA